MTSYTYDNLGRNLSTTYDDGTVLAYAYDGYGNLYSVKETDGDETSQTYYTYDSLGRLVNSRLKEGETTILQTSQEYDGSNKLTEQSWLVGDGTEAGDYSEHYVYDANDGLLVEVERTGTDDTQNIHYDGLRRLSAVENEVYMKQYSYRDISETRTTDQVATLAYAGLEE